MLMSISRSTRTAVALQGKSFALSQPCVRITLYWMLYVALSGLRWRTNPAVIAFPGGCRFLQTSSLDNAPPKGAGRSRRGKRTSKSPAMLKAASQYIQHMFGH